MYFDDSLQAASNTLDIIAFVIKRMSSENFSLKLLPWVFYRMEEIYLYDVDFNIALLNKAILPL